MQTDLEFCVLHVNALDCPNRLKMSQPQSYGTGPFTTSLGRMADGRPSMGGIDWLDLP